MTQLMTVKCIDFVNYKLAHGSENVNIGQSSWGGTPLLYYTSQDNNGKHP